MYGFFLKKKYWWLCLELVQHFIFVNKTSPKLSQILIGQLQWWFVNIIGRAVIRKLRFNARVKWWKRVPQSIINQTKKFNELKVITTLRDFDWCTCAMVQAQIRSRIWITSTFFYQNHVEKVSKYLSWKKLANLLSLT